MMKKRWVIPVVTAVLLSACANQGVDVTKNTVVESTQESVTDTSSGQDSAISETDAPISKAKLQLTYSNLADEESRSELKQALQNAGVSKEHIQEFFDSVDEYNQAVGTENLAKKITTISEAFPSYDDHLVDLWKDNGGGFVGRNCRITSYMLMRDFITVGNPVAGDTNMLFADFEAIDKKKIFTGNEKKNFDSIFSYIDVSKTEDTNILAGEIQKDWEKKQIAFHGDKIHMISLFMVMDDGKNPVQEFIGHTGVLLEDGDGYLFVEKLAFEMPYQFVKFANRQEVNDYLMGYYDKDLEGAKPIIFEDNHVLPEYRVLEDTNMKLSDFSSEEQKEIKEGLSEGVVDDKEAAKKILSLVPEEYMKKIPFFVRSHATSKTIEKIAKEHPVLYAYAKKEGEIPNEQKEQLKSIVVGIFQERMEKHRIQ